MAQAQYRAWEVYGQDAVVPQSDNYYIAEGFGLAVEHHPDSTPTAKRTAVDDLEGVWALKVPDPQRDGRMPVYLEAIRRLAQSTQGQVAIRAPGTGPFSLAAHLLGPERLLTELALVERHPNAKAAASLRHLMELTTAALIAFAKACLEAGAHLVQAGDSLASPDAISPQMYRRWAFPFEQRFFTELRPAAAKLGAATLLHICGNTTPILDQMADTGAQILELDSKVDLAVAKARVGRRVCLMGNLNPVEVLWRGNPSQVEAAARRAIADAGQGGGFILGSGCEVPPAAPQANLRALIAEARRSRYPAEGL
jgi:uroporphyrinogen decarboxylase